MHSRLNPWALAGFIAMLLSAVGMIAAAAAWGGPALRYAAWVVLTMMEAVA